MLATRAIVVVRYEACGVTLLDECRPESGAYLQPQWAPGKLETVDIRTEKQLIDALPLAASLLGARVSGGESFHLEYYIAGTQRANRDEVSRADLAAVPGCEGATHFVHALDLGASALASTEHHEAAAAASTSSVEVGGRLSRSRSVLHKSGDLSTCNVEDPTAAGQCRAPIRLTLRELQ